VATSKKSAAPAKPSGECKVILRIEQWDNGEVKNSVEMIEHCSGSQDALRKYTHIRRGATRGVELESEEMAKADGFNFS
jgi:hypothetical protein